MKYALFKGCFLPVRLPHIEKISVQVLGDLGVDLVDLQGFSCCPEPVGFLSNDSLTGMAVAARNISLAEEEKLDILTLCNGCTYTLKQVNEALKGNGELREKVNDVLSAADREFRGTVEVRHFASIISEEIGGEKISRLVENQLTGLGVASHTGCHIVSPREVMAFDDPLDPVVLDGLVRALGASPSDFELKTLCCGWTLTNYGDKEGADKVLGAKLGAMNDARADCIATICPQCFYQFDTGQMLTVRRLGLDFKIPVFFYPQLLGLAMGYTLDEIGYPRHRVKTPDLEAKIGGLIK